MGESGGRKCVGRAPLAEKVVGEARLANHLSAQTDVGFAGKERTKEKEAAEEKVCFGVSSSISLKEGVHHGKVVDVEKGGNGQCSREGWKVGPGGGQQLQGWWIWPRLSVTEVRSSVGK